MTIEELKKQAKKDFKKLSKIVAKFDGPPKELCLKLSGFNYDNDEQFFDCDFGVLGATIKWTKKGMFVSKHIDIWDNKDAPGIVCSVSIDEI